MLANCTTDNMLNEIPYNVNYAIVGKYRIGYPNLTKHCLHAPDNPVDHRPVFLVAFAILIAYPLAW